MYEVTVSAGFAATHAVRSANGQAEALHRHNWRVEAGYAGSELDSSGTLIDFVEAGRALGEIVAQLDGADLNTSAFLGGLNPTAELVARSIFSALARRVRRPDLLAWVRVGEAPGCWAAFARVTHRLGSSSGDSVDDKSGAS